MSYAEELQRQMREKKEKEDQERRLRERHDYEIEIRIKEEIEREKSMQDEKKKIGGGNRQKVTFSPQVNKRQKPLRDMSPAKEVNPKL